MSSEYELTPSQGRLQRPPDFTGRRLQRFSQVALRHGLPGALLGALCLYPPQMRELLRVNLEGMLREPVGYLTAGLAILAGLLTYAWFLDRKIDAAAAGWVLYLLAVSIWEEWVFRLAVPYYAQMQGFSLPVMALLSNLAFGLMHYFTLRWKWQWCLAAFIGGLALSRNLDAHHNLAVIIALHWIATFLNTPRPPGARARQRISTPTGQ